MNRSTLNEILEKSSPDVCRLNSGLLGLGGLDPGQRGKPQSPLDREAPARRRSRARVQAGAEIVVTIVAHIRRRMDDDNLATGCKPLRDAIAGELGVDDGDPNIRWEYGQVETRGRTGVTVKIEILRR